MNTNTTSKFDIIVIGGGIVGLASAWKLQCFNPNLRILVVEKENELAPHQTGHNSGVIHSGLYYKPGSYKAKNCVSGRRELVEFAKKHNISHDVCGKLVVAATVEEVPRLKQLFETGLKNEVEALEMIDEAQIKAIEPFCKGVAAIRVGCTGIIDFRGVTNKLAQLITDLNDQSKILTSCEVKSISDLGESKIVHTTQGDFKGNHIVFCCGLQSDRMAKKDGGKNLGMRIVGFRGDYYDLTQKGHHKVKHLIYPVPNPAFPFLGVHFTRMVDGSIECGPNAVFTFKREGYNKLDFNLKDTLEALSYVGTWKLLTRHWKFGLDEYRRAFSKKLFLKQLQKLIPSLELDDLKPGRAGVRAMALDLNGEMIDDFKIVYLDRSLHVLNAPSPAATAALAVGEEVRKMAEQYFSLKPGEKLSSPKTETHTSDKTNNPE